MKLGRLAFFLVLGVVVIGHAAESIPGYQALPLTISPEGRTGFRLLPPARTGIHFSTPRLE